MLSAIRYNERQSCRNCYSTRIIQSNEFSGEMVCSDCGRVSHYLFENEIPYGYMGLHKTYKRIFYFNERTKRWGCEEPKIPWDLLLYIRYEASKPKYGGKDKINRRTISKILKSVNLPLSVREKYRSQKFKKTLLTKKRFYDKFYEKWKTICCYLTGEETNIPGHGYIEYIQRLFLACQIPFELYKHKPECDRRHKCEKIFGCWNNFINYDFIFRKLMQIAEIKVPNFKGNYEKYKDEFPLVSKKIRDTKLKPLFQQICQYNRWPIIEDD